MSAAIEAHCGLMWTTEVERALRDAVGDDGVALAKEIHAFADDGAFWTGTDDPDPYGRMQALLRARYPFLSHGAVVRMATAGAWSWR